ncbi:hypothetical protein TNCV_3365071 [Trichonephila clavipes]|nr:hypothetical protein TNCV_3365071 [Trichonephila clavipes]
MRSHDLTGFALDPQINIMLTLYLQTIPWSTSSPSRRGGRVEICKQKGRLPSPRDEKGSEAECHSRSPTTLGGRQTLATEEDDP